METASTVCSHKEQTKGKQWQSFCEYAAFFNLFFFVSRSCLVELSNFNLKTRAMCCNIISHHNRKGNLRLQSNSKCRQRFEEVSTCGCYFLNGKEEEVEGRGKKKERKMFLFYYFLPPFVSATSSEGCALGRTLIKISVPGAPFASCTTSGTSGSQIQIIGYLGQVMWLGENINTFTMATLLT